MKGIESFKRAMLIMQMVKFHHKEYKPFCIVLEKCALMSEERRPPYEDFMSWQFTTKRMLNCIDLAEVQVERARQFNMFPYMYQYKECKQFLKQYRLIVKKWYWLFPLLAFPWLPMPNDSELVMMGLSHDPWPIDIRCSRLGRDVRIKG